VIGTTTFIIMLFHSNRP